MEKVLYDYFIQFSHTFSPIVIIITRTFERRKLEFERNEVVYLNPCYEYAVQTEFEPYSLVLSLFKGRKEGREGQTRILEIRR